MSAAPHSPALRRAALSAALALVLALLAARTTGLLGPHTAALDEYNADAAVPVLMCEAPVRGFFDVYYWGQDRFGSWPFHLTGAAAHAVGTRCTPELLHAVMTLWVLTGALALGALVRRARLLAVGFYMLTVLGIAEVRGILFELAQVYPWQLPLVLWAWWALRADLEARVGGGGRASTLRAGALGFLAVWTSTTSGPILLALAGVEWLRLQREGLPPEAGPTRAAVAPTRQRLPAWAYAFLLVAVPIALEAIMRGRYSSHARRTVGIGYRTRLELDWAHLADNVREVAGLLARSGPAWLLLVGTAGAVFAAWRLVRPRPGGSEPERVLLGAWAAAAVQLPLLAGLSHIRLNAYNPRYFTLVLVFGALAGLLTLAVGLHAAAALIARRLAHVTLPALGLLALALGALRLPPYQPSTFLADLRATAERQAARAPGTPLLGSYWDTYLLASLAGEAALPPVPAEGEYQRTTWWSRTLGQAPRVLVAHGFPAVGPPEAPAPWLAQHGALLQLETPRLDTGARHTFALYRTRTADARPLAERPVLEAWRACDPAAALPLRLAAPAARATLLVATGDAAEGPTLQAEPLLDQGTAAPVPLLRAGHLHVLELQAPAGAQLVGVQLRAAAVHTPAKPQECQAKGAWVVDVASAP